MALLLHEPPRLYSSPTVALYYKIDVEDGKYCGGTTKLGEFACAIVAAVRFVELFLFAFIYFSFKWGVFDFDLFMVFTVLSCGVLLSFAIGFVLCLILCSSERALMGSNISSDDAIKSWRVLNSLFTSVLEDPAFVTSDKAFLGRSLLRRGKAALSRGDVDAARVLFQEAIEVVSDPGTPSPSERRLRSVCASTRRHCPAYRRRCSPPR